jgi:hypothetical protein
MYPSEPFPHFVDDYLAYLYEVCPTHATLDGNHLHDDLLEDLSRPAVDAHVRALSGFGRRLHQIDSASLPPTERIEHPIVASNIEARMFEYEEVRTWERSPQLYADLIGMSLAGQALFAYAPEADRARRIVSKLRQVPRLVQAARDNIKDTPGIYVKTGLESWRGLLKFIDADLPRAFASLDDLHILGDLADTSTRPISRRAPKHRSVWDAKSSRRSCGWTKASPSRRIDCCRSRCASCTTCRRSSARRRRSCTAATSRPRGAPRRTSIRRRARSSRRRRSR